MRRSKSSAIAWVTFLVTIGFVHGCGARPTNGTQSPGTPDSESTEIQVGVDTDVNNEVLFVAASNAGETLIGIGEKDAEGNAVALTGAVHVTSDENASIVYADSEGLPARVIAQDWELSISNYANDFETADVVIWPPDGTPELVQSLQLSENVQLGLRNLKIAGQGAQLAKLTPALQESDGPDLLAFASNLVSIGSCIYGLATNDPNWLTAGGCVSTFLSQLTGGSQNTVILSTTVHAAECLVAPVPVNPNCWFFAADVVREAIATAERTCTADVIGPGAAFRLLADPCRPEPGDAVSVTVNIWPAVQFEQSNLVSLTVEANDGGTVESDLPDGGVLKIGPFGEERFALLSAREAVAYTVYANWNRRAGEELATSLVIRTQSLQPSTQDGELFADAGADQTVVDQDCDGKATVVLNAASSYDTRGAPMSFVWMEHGVLLGSASYVEVPFTVGSHTITLTIGRTMDTVKTQDSLSVLVLPGTRCSLGDTTDLLTSVVAMDASSHTLVIIDDRTVWGWGYGMESDVARQIANLIGAVSISCGDVHDLALMSDGTVWAWGSNFHGQLVRLSHFLEVFRES